MPATLTIDDELYRAAARAAAARSLPVDEFVAELVRHAVRPPLPLRRENGVPVFDVGPGARPFTSDDVRRAEDEA